MLQLCQQRHHKSYSDDICGQIMFSKTIESPLNAREFVKALSTCWGHLLYSGSIQDSHPLGTLKVLWEINTSHKISFRRIISKILKFCPLPLGSEQMKLTWLVWRSSVSQCGHIAGISEIFRNLFWLPDDRHFLRTTLARISDSFG